MIVKPSHQAPRPVALVTPGWRSMRIQTRDEDRFLNGEQRIRKALEELKGHVVYARGLLRLLHTTGATVWQATAWRGRAVSMSLDGTSTNVLSLRNALDGATAEEQIEALVRVQEWLAGYGVRMGSLSSMAWHLWCATLTDDVRIASLPAIGQAAFYGPRQEVREPKRYQHMGVVDMSFAYPTAMVERPFALTLREVSSATALDRGDAGLARARVRVPAGLPFAPLPTRIADGVIQWRDGHLTGTWPWCELAEAQDLGCDVTVERCFAPMLTAQPFDRWHAILAEGRALPGWAGRLLKPIGNGLWGMFAMAGDHTQTVRWLDDEGEQPLVVARSQRRLPQAATAHVAAETASRVRVRVLDEIYRNADEGLPVHIDTDGMIVREQIASHYPNVAGPGQFRRKVRMRRLDVKAPQLLRYGCDQPCCEDRWHDDTWGNVTTDPHPDRVLHREAVADARDREHWHYVAAGMSPEAAREIFERVPSPSRVAVLDQEVVLPQCHSWEVDKLKPWLAEARGLKTAMFGEGLDR